MIDIIVNTTSSYKEQLNTRLKAIAGVYYLGSSMGVKTVAHLADDTGQSIQDDILAAIQVHNTLTVQASKLSVIADGIDETVITCNELLTDIECRIFRGDTLSSDTTVNDGSIELSLNEQGIVIVEIKDPNSYTTGYIEIEGT